MRFTWPRLLAASTLLLCSAAEGQPRVIPSGSWNAEFGLVEEAGSNSGDIAPSHPRGLASGPLDPFDAAAQIAPKVPPSPKGPPSGPVSVHALMHPPKRKAVDQFMKAQRYSEAGDYVRAMEALERAIRISPDYAEAHINLGAQYLRMSQWDKGVAEFTRAEEIAGPNPVALANMAYAQIYQGHMDEATANLRQSLALDRYSPKANYLMGIVLSEHPQTRAEALPHLELASRTFPSARPLLERVRNWMSRR